MTSSFHTQINEHQCKSNQIVKPGVPAVLQNALKTYENLRQYMNSESEFVIFEKQRIGERLKKSFALKDKSMRLAVQVVGNRVESYFDKAWTEGEARCSRLVIIGFSGMNKNEIGKILSF